VFERFTEVARQVVVLGQDEARALGHNYIGTEHILLGLLRVEEGLAARVLESLDVTVEKARAQVVRIVGEGDEIATGQIPFTPGAKKVLELGLREALSLGDNYVASEHLLLGLVGEGEGVGMQVLQAFDISPEAVRSETIRTRSEPLSEEQEQRSNKKRGRRALEAAVVYVAAAKELAIANQEFHQASQITEVERALNAILKPPE
jgi:ATP-dependent Clp protease ATP-binding subunit ClpC